MSNMVRKASVFEILNHWSLAVSFFILTVSGFGFLYHIEGVGSIFGGFNQMKTIHNWAGVVFSVSLFFTLFSYIVEALSISGDDIAWIFKGGGYFSKKTVVPPQGKLNTGQKLYYLTVLIAGIAITATGLVIWLRPEMADIRKWILLSHLVHNISFVFMVIAIPLHIYLATLANPGTVRIMFYGTVPVEWARKRHPKWVQKIGA
ncbi:MAG: formate dehydrogenase subunit gamma [Nitrospirota bacterium]